MQSGTARIVIAITLIVVLTLATLRNILLISVRLLQGDLSPYLLGTIVGAGLAAAAIGVSILFLRGGLQKRNAWNASRRTRQELQVAPPAPSPDADRKVYDRFPVTWQDTEIDLQREYPEEFWTSLPLDEDVVAAWLGEHGFTRDDGGRITAELLRTSGPNPLGTLQQLTHGDPEVSARSVAHMGRLRGISVELRTDDVAIRTSIVDGLHRLAAEHDTYLRAERSSAPALRRDVRSRR